MRSDEVNFKPFVILVWASGSVEFFPFHKIAKAL